MKRETRRQRSAWREWLASLLVVAGVSAMIGGRTTYGVMLTLGVRLAIDCGKADR